MTPILTSAGAVSRTRSADTPRALVALLLLSAISAHLGVARAADSSAAGAAALKILLELEDHDKQSQASAAGPRTSPADPGASRPTRRNAPMPPASAIMLSTGVHTTVQVSRTETLESVIRRSVPQLPLKDSVVRQAFIQLNPQAFPVRNVTVIRAGTVLRVPNTDDLRTVAIRESPSAASLFLGNSLPQEAPLEETREEKRQWVRFP